MGMLNFLMPTLTYCDVTDQDITIGEPRNSETCPVALALGRSFPHWLRVDIGSHSHVQIFWKKIRIIDMTLEHESAMWVENFDRGKRCEPTTIWLKRGY